MPGVNNLNVYVNAKTIATGGTVQVLLSPGGSPGAGQGNPIQSAIVKARKGNTSALYVGSGTTGGGTSGSSLSSTTGFELQPGDSVSLDILGVGFMYIIGATTGDRYDVLQVGP